MTPADGEQETLRLWRSRVRSAEAAGARTPFYLFTPDPIAYRAAELEWHLRGRPVRLWYSFKTQPCAPVLRWWRRQGGPVEVVSEFELRAAFAEGFAVDDILVNGPAKQRWLPGLSRPGLRVHFDSPGELQSLLPVARRDRWRVGLRVRTAEEFDPGDPQAPTQFGFTPAEATSAWRRLQASGMGPESLHFHLRTNVAEAGAFRRALGEIVELCRGADLRPRFLDVGGGLPAAGPCGLRGERLDAGMNLSDYAAALHEACDVLPSVEVLWLEPGRRLLSGAGALVVTVLDAKNPAGRRQLVCDGGRTLHAMPSVWEEHALHPLRRSRPPCVLTAVHGPTCMAYDRLALRPLPEDLRAGDRLLWLDAGAYHLSWETRFSHGLAAVWWWEDGVAELARPAEPFEAFWAGWRGPGSGLQRS